jgi:hypothetical protein
MRSWKIQDGIFFAGMTIVGDKYLGNHIFTTGGLYNANLLKDITVTRKLIHTLEHKVDTMHYCYSGFEKVELASL